MVTVNDEAIEFILELKEANDTTTKIISFPDYF